MTELEAYYGLPGEVVFCTRCVISNQRPNSAVEYAHQKDSKKSTIGFDADGVCDACLVAEKKAETDWEQRERELHELSAQVKDFDGPYNCIVPGSGGKDSFLQAHQLKYKFGFRPLTVTWAPHLYTDWGRKNHDAWVHAGFDNVMVSPNGLIHRLLTRLAVDNLFHPFQPFMIGQKSLAPRLAVRWGIPLVFYGENEAEYGNPLADTYTALRDPSFFQADNPRNISLGGVPVSSLVEDYGVPYNELDMYLPVDSKAASKLGLEVRYLGYYVKWHPQGAYYYAVENGGFQPSPERTPGTYSKYNSIDDKIDDLHYWSTFIKFGIGRATYDAAQEIRNGEITREEGVALVRKFDGEWPQRFESELMEYLSVDSRLGQKTLGKFSEPIMTTEKFKELADSFRSPHLWSRDLGDWSLRHVVS